MIKGFKDFLLRGNVVDLAVAVVIGAAFTAVVSSFTSSFLTPLITIFTGGGELAGVVLVSGEEFRWGAFVTQLIRFVITAAVIYFFIVAPMRRLVRRRAEGEETGPSAPSEVELLVEIRDLLRAQQSQPPASEPEAAPHR
ncbi:large conductance mechanosensitive channel [Modestobacter sp. DSM 44400]|uniref:large conductance mechanosensitive channel protein MscL n=1 Tax=Modestobacter sp. DSM 44400 TaxID=1550230 RepID=UPI00089801FB|nr:large conductance mechanosensitive channel protein MscL [Modestobacter sp. DSM 44400]SDY59152.1 large conductance mechanosensitive channel [Modestobacter sp. DSM 44400]